MTDFTAECPISISDYPTVQLAHGGGGRLMNQLIDTLFRPAFDNDLLNAAHDGAVFEVDGRRLAFSTDSYVVNPLFFPGGDIGHLAICGTVNDLAMCGARPLYLSAGFIIEEGFPMQDLWRVVQSMRCTADQVGVQIVTGDTKVVDRGKGDGLFINTAGVGSLEHDNVIGSSEIQEGDLILLSGDLGRHGTAIMASREGLAFESTIESDCAPLSDVVLSLIEAGIELHALRDLTRGGLATAAAEIAEASGLQLHVESTKIPVCLEVRGACEILGLDPNYVANEGRMILVVPSAAGDAALACLKKHAVSSDACIIGAVLNEHPGKATIRSEIGVTRILDMLSGEQLPRIC